MYDPKDGTPLLHVMTMKAKDLSWFLSHYKCNINITDPKGRTVLIHECQKLDVLKVLISHGADIHISDLEGNTPVMRYAKWGCIEHMLLLLDHGASLDEAYSSYLKSPKRNAQGVVLLDAYRERADQCRKVAMVFVALGKKRHVLQHDVAKLLGQYIWSTRRAEEWEN
jgi:ankyrin repeat protein